MNCPTPTPPPGVYRGIPFSTYRQWDAANKSTLDWLVTDCPAVCRHRTDNPEPETPAMLLGRALHTLTLEGLDRFRREFVTAPKCDRRTKEGKALWETFTLAAEGRTVLTEDQAGVVRAMNCGLSNCPDVAEFMASPGENELSLVWRDPETGLLCKARLDLLRPSWNAIGDLKTCQSAHPERFARQIMDRGYHRQAAFYLRGAAALGLDVEYFALIPVEKDAPHAAALYLMDEESLAIGDAEIMAALRVYAECREAGVWPGYAKPAGGEYRRVGLPAWARRKGGAA